ncbi:PREDICTED: uncharacterized protein LOC105977367 [Erythranthe guttata]|uniref:uncharacterized protein LOC105977367 n=1 Tax=Erythranthe guttata TaxID=4155 RepID=UPI00064DD6A9|nr:PREDICTED: uncharacterized protein LOC105977367 [Erythranthe guttata]|eukprot:XP_012858121.1 PREDICTED: uncharacterized protein LOC105977367 [Erythranthe guttata]
MANIDPVNEPYDDNLYFDPSVLDKKEYEDFSHFFQVDIVFGSREELINWAKETAVSHCHRLICQSRRENAQYMTCDKYGHGRQTNIDVEDPRNSGTKKCGCPFKLIGKRSRFDELWRLTVSDGRHSHRPTLFPHGQGTTSRITPQQKARIKELRNSHVKPMLIMDRLRKDDPTIQTSMKHVYNELAKIKSEEMEGMTVIQFMMHNFQKGEYRYWHRVDSETSNTITDIMFACPESIQLLRLFPYVILMDCTYKTNKYGMPLLEIIGITPVGRNYTIAVAFMSHEDADTYEWTLNCLKELLDGVEPDAILTDRELGLLKALPNVFPFSYHMLCIFHINRNVEANATKFMGGNKDQGLIFRRVLWAKLVKSETEEEYHYNYNEIVGRYAGYPRLIQYLNDTWLIYKEKFVRAYTRNVYHFGNTSTNRVESAHSSAKGWLNASTGGLDNVQGKLRDQVYIQISELKCDFSLSSKIRKHTAAWPCFQGLICYVTHLALEKLDEEMESPAMQDPSICTHYLWNTHGLPCACKIVQKMEDNDTFVISDLHPFWSTMAVEPSELPEYQVNREEIVDRQIDDLNCNLKKMNYTSKINAVASLRGIVYPSTSHLSEPSFVKTKGRPKNNSTKRDPSGWQYHIDEETIKSSCGSKGRQTSSGAKIPKTKVERSTDGTPQSKMKGRGSRIPTQESAAPTIPAHEGIDFYSFVPRFMVRLIQDYVNVMADGNCGYRCVAQAVYGDQERWPQVRGELLIELYEHASVYTAMFGSTGYVEVIRKCDWTSGPCPQAYWMDMNEMGLAIATRYSALVVLLTQVGSMTYLPMFGSGHLSCMIVVTLHNNHFMFVNLVANSPLPPIHPAWVRHRAKNLRHLLKTYKPRLLLYEQLKSGR